MTQGSRNKSAWAVVVDRLLEYWEHGYLLQNLVAREIKVRYRRSVLGVVWTLLNPIMMMTIFTVVFSTLFAHTLVNFPVYFLSAYMTWHYFAQTTSTAMGSLVRSAALYKRINVPKHVFVLAVIVSDSINFLISLIPLAALMLILRHPVTPALLFTPIALLILLAVTTGISFFVATVAVFFNDITQFYAVILQAVMYLTALFYPLSIVPPSWQRLILLNPMYHVVQLIRAPIYDGQLPTAENMIGGALAAVVALAVGWTVFSRSSDRFVYYV